MEIFKLGDDILALLEMVLGFWNNQINLVFSLLGQSPVSFKGGGPWAVVENLQPLFVGVGSGLVVLFFVIGFCAESVDIKSEFRLEAMLRMLIRLGIAQWLVANNLTILKAFFSSIGAMVSHLGNTTMAQASIGAGEAEVIENLGFAASLIFLLLSVVLSLIILICGFFIIYTVYFRFLKIMVIVPLAAIAFSTLAGNRTVSTTCVRYFKYFLSVVMEAVTMALAILICNAFISAGFPAFTGGYARWEKADKEDQNNSTENTNDKDNKNTSDKNQNTSGTVSGNSVGSPSDKDTDTKTEGGNGNAGKGTEPVIQTGHASPFTLLSALGLCGVMLAAASVFEGKKEGKSCL